MTISGLVLLPVGGGIVAVQLSEHLAEAFVRQSLRRPQARPPLRGKTSALQANKGEGQGDQRKVDHGALFTWWGVDHLKSSSRFSHLRTKKPRRHEVRTGPSG